MLIEVSSTLRLIPNTILSKLFFILKMRHVSANDPMTVIESTGMICIASEVLLWRKFE